MPSEHAPPRPLSVVVTGDDVLRDSLRRLAQEGGRAAQLSELMRSRAADTSPGPTAPGVDRDILAACDALTGDLLTNATPQSACAVVEALRRVRDLRLASQTSGEGSADSELRTRLRSADAFDLLVEVAHDFRSPLTSILFLAETLRDGISGPVNEVQRSQLGLMYSAAFGLASVASDVLDTARPVDVLLDDRPHAYSPREIVAGVVRLIGPIAEEKRLELRVVAPDLSQAWGQPHALSRVLLNLATNALKFTDQGHVEIGFRARSHGRLGYYVQDTGRGIPVERQVDLFKPFKRRLGEGQQGHYFSGSGVGLSIVRRLVRAMGTELILETSERMGTCFSFDLPNVPPRGS